MRESPEMLFVLPLPLYLRKEHSDAYGEYSQLMQSPDVLHSRVVGCSVQELPGWSGSFSPLQIIG